MNSGLGSSRGLASDDMQPRAAATGLSGPSRAAAALIALTAWVGLAVQFHALLGRTASPAAALWEMLAYFTVTTNLLVAILLTGVAVGRPTFAAPRLAAGVTLAILLVGVIYHLLLNGLRELSGGDVLADRLLHSVTPAITPLYWLAFVRKGTLTRRDPLLWAIYPLAYFGYALARGAAAGRYAYPFLNMRDLGWPRTGANALMIALGFLAVSYALVWLDHRLGRSIPAELQR